MYVSTLNPKCIDETFTEVHMFRNEAQGRITNPEPVCIYHYGAIRDIVKGN